MSTIPNEGQQARIDTAIKNGAIPIADLPAPHPDAIRRAATYFRVYLWMIVGTAILLVVLLCGAFVFGTIAVARQKDIRDLVTVNACIARFQGVVQEDNLALLQVDEPQRAALIEARHMERHADQLKNADNYC